MAVASTPSRRTPTALRIAAVPVVAALLVAGAILVVGQLLPGNVWIKYALSAVWFIAAGAVLRRGRRGDLARPGAASSAILGRSCSPVYVTAPPGDRRRLFVVEQVDRLRVLVGGRLRKTPFLSIPLAGDRGRRAGAAVVFTPPSRRLRALGSLLRLLRGPLR